MNFCHEIFLAAGGGLDTSKYQNDTDESQKLG